MVAVRQNGPDPWGKVQLVVRFTSSCLQLLISVIGFKLVLNPSNEQLTLYFIF